MDIQMPELDGIAVTTLLREREKLTGTRQFVVAMTALAMKSDRERCLAAGMDGYLAKPIRGPELDDVLEGRIMQQQFSLKQVLQLYAGIWLFSFVMTLLVSLLASPASTRPPSPRSSAAPARPARR